MLEALKEAAKAAEKDEVPIGAVVVCGGRVIARAHNLTEALYFISLNIKLLDILHQAK